MSKLTDLEFRLFAGGWERGVKHEQDRIFRIAEEIKMENEIGEYIYLSDLRDYLAEEGNK